MPESLSFLSAAPILEIKTLRKEKKEIPAFTVANDYHIDSLLADNDGAYELALEITAGEAEIMGFSLFNDKGEKVDIYFNLPEKRLVMDRTKSGIVDFGKKSVPHEIEVHDRRKTTSIFISVETLRSTGKNASIPCSLQAMASFVTQPEKAITGLPYSFAIFATPIGAFPMTVPFLVTTLFRMTSKQLIRSVATMIRLSPLS